MVADFDFVSISPTDGDVFWGLPDGEMETPVGRTHRLYHQTINTPQITLASTPNDSKNQWIFARTSA
jgi:hypothetical protein